MRFWVYEAASHAARGPYEVAQLKDLPGFGPETIVAPEHAQAADEWRPASVFTGIQPIFRKHPTVSVPPMGKARPLPGTRGPLPQTTASKKSEYSSAVTVQEPARTGRRWLKPAVLTAGAFLAASVGLIMHPSLRVHAKSASAHPPLDPASWQGREQDAISLVKSFPVREPLMARCPRRIEDVDQGVGHNYQDVPGWPEVKTVQDAYDCSRFVPMLLMLEKLASETDKSPDAIAQAIHSSPESFRSYETKLTFSWTAKDQGAGRYRVDAKVGMDGPAVKKIGGATESRDAWAVDLPGRSVQPLLASTWFKFDSKAYNAWAAAEAQRDPNSRAASTEPSVWAEIDVSGAAPSYGADGSEATVAAAGSHASPRL